MGVVDHFVWAGPADSRGVRLLFYLGDGILLGAILYFVVVLSSSFGGSEWFVGPALAIAGFFVVVFLARLFRDVWAGVLAGREESRSWVDEEWKATRRWLWLVAVAILIAVLLGGLTVLFEGWTWGSFPASASPLGFGAVLVGLLLRETVRYRVETQTNPPQ